MRNIAEVIWIKIQNLVLPPKVWDVMPGSLEIPLTFNNLELKCESKEWQIPWKERKSWILPQTYALRRSMFTYLILKTRQIIWARVLTFPKTKDQGTGERRMFSLTPQYSKFTNLRKSLNLSELWDLLWILSVYQWKKGKTWLNFAFLYWKKIKLVKI